MNIVEQLRSHTRQSAFNRQGYQVTLEFADLYRSLAFYYERYKEDVSDENLIEAMTPDFQRANDKWSQERKIKFVENILCGYPSTIMLFTVNNELLDDCQIIDGLQRLTALDDWMKNKFKVFGEFYHKDFNDCPRRAPYVDVRLSLCIHRFDTLKEAVQFYIDINEGISHSSEDILKAKDYLKTL